MQYRGEVGNTKRDLERVKRPLCIALGVTSASVFNPHVIGESYRVLEGSRWVAKLVQCPGVVVCAVTVTIGSIVVIVA